jgi:TM2 domain-containing membrane protein YozV
MDNMQYSSKDKTTCALLAFFLGGLGVHRFYVKKTGTGIIMLLLCWTGISVIWALVDFITILRGKFTDGEGKIIGSKNSAAMIQPSPIANVPAEARPISPDSDSDMLKCGNCGKEANPNTKFCNYCGSPLTKKCGKCNADNPMEYKFCKECGNSL